MKKPSLEEVKEYFKDAELVKNRFGKEFEICEIVHGRCPNSFMNINKNKNKNDYNSDRATVWEETGGYAEILTYKEPKGETFVISRDQIETIYEDGCTYIKEWFPKALEHEKKELGLDIGKWYFVERPQVLFDDKVKALIFYEEKDDLYGFDHEGRWMDYYGNPKTDKYVFELATPEEVKEALTKEAVKRGFIGKNLYIKLENKHYQLQSEKGDFQLIGDIFFYQGAPILNKGVWAEIIPTITKAEAEQKLNCKII